PVTPGDARSEPDRLLAMAPLAAIARLAAPTTLVMAVAAVSKVGYPHFVSPLGVGGGGGGSLVFPVSRPPPAAVGRGHRAGGASGRERRRRWRARWAPADAARRARSPGRRSC